MRGVRAQAPFSVVLQVSALVGADVHAHASRAEVMGLLGGRRAARTLRLAAYRPAAAAAAASHCDMDPGTACLLLASTFSLYSIIHILRRPIYYDGRCGVVAGILAMRVRFPHSANICVHEHVCLY
jgi:hypothetical protein